MDAVYFVKSGLLRAYFQLVDGSEKTKEFFWQQDYILLFRPLLSDLLLPFGVVALEPCELVRLPVNTYLAQLKDDDCWRDFHHAQLATHLLYKEKKEAFLLLNNPEQRVAQFLAEFDWLCRRVPDYVIASYLGITPISFSRIKKRLR